MMSITRRRLDAALAEYPDAYDTFEKALLVKIAVAPESLSNHELDAILTSIDGRLVNATREFKVRFVNKHPQHADLFELRGQWVRLRGQTAEHWDNLFTSTFSMETARLLKETMRVEGLNVYEAKGRLQRAGHLNLNDGLVSRYGIFIHDRWGIGTRPRVRAAA